MRVSLWRGLVSALALVAVVGGVCTRADETATAYAERSQFADGLFSRGMYQLALREYAGLLDKFPDGAQNDQLEYRRAESHRLLGQGAEAAKSFDRVFAGYPASAYRLRAAYRRARLYMEAGDCAAATEHFKAILGMTPDAQIGMASMYYMGEALMACERDEDAEDAYGLIEAKYPDSAFAPFALMKRAEILRQRWDSAASEGALPKPGDKVVGQILALYEKVLESPGGDRTAAEALFQMAELHFRLKDYTRSAEFYRRLMRDHADDKRVGEARLQAAWAASYAGLFADALTLTESALVDVAGPKRGEWLYLKANCERQLGRLEAAVASYVDLLARFPKGTFSAAARYELALAYYKLGRHEEAVAVAERIELTSRMKLEVSRLLAECYAALEQVDKSIQYYRLIEREAPEGELQRDAIYRLGYHLQAQGNYRDAAQFYTKLAERYAKHKQAPQALFAAGSCHLNAGDQASASRDWGRLVREYPDSPMQEEALYQKAMADLRLARPEDAQSALADLLRRFPKGRYPGDAHYWLGTIQMTDEKIEDALISFTQAGKLATRPELNRQADYSLALALQKLGREAEAAKVFGRVLATPLAGDIAPAVLEWLAGYYHGAKQYGPAVLAAERLTGEGRDPAWRQVGYALIGRAQLALKQPAAAREAFTKALAQPSATRYGAEAALRLAELALADGDTAAASDFYTQASGRAASPETLGIRARAFFGLGAAAAQGEQHADAARYFMSVAILYDDAELVPDALWRAGSHFDALEQPRDATAADEELVERYPQSPRAKQARQRLEQRRVAAASSSDNSISTAPEGRSE